jgi:hydroxymethylpyrimidine/phosphomethylpyrimidine kinase
MQEYEQNLQLNNKEKERNIEEANGLIREKEDDLVIRTGHKRDRKQMMHILFLKKNNRFWLRICL